MLKIELSDASSVEFFNDEDSDDQDRFIRVGHSSKNRILPILRILKRLVSSTIRPVNGSPFFYLNSQGRMELRSSPAWKEARLFMLHNFGLMNEFE